MSAEKSHVAQNFKLFIRGVEVPNFELPIDKFFGESEAAYKPTAEKLPAATFQLNTSSKDWMLNWAELLEPKPEQKLPYRLCVIYKNGDIGFYNDVSDDTLRLMSRYVKACNRAPRAWQKFLDGAVKIGRSYPTLVTSATTDTKVIHKAHLNFLDFK